MTTDVSFVWLEITGRCQLSCNHCYADSGLSGTHGTMTADDWRRTIDQAAALGVEMVQFIGGEPTLYPALPELIAHALAAGVQVEVYSNLVHVTPRMWETFGQPGVRPCLLVLQRSRRSARGGYRYGWLACPDPGQHRRGGTPLNPAARRCRRPGR